MNRHARRSAAARRDRRDTVHATRLRRADGASRAIAQFERARAEAGVVDGCVRIHDPEPALVQAWAQVVGKEYLEPAVLAWHDAVTASPLVPHVAVIGHADDPVTIALFGQRPPTEVAVGAAPFARLLALMDEHYEEEGDFQAHRAPIRAGVARVFVLSGRGLFFTDVDIGAELAAVGCAS